MSEQPASQPPPPQPQWTGDSPRYYANALAINSGPFDVMLIFGRQEASPGGGNQPPIEEVARVTVSWAHAKSLIPLLARIVAAYEQKYGSIPAPGFEENWRA